MTHIRFQVAVNPLPVPAEEGMDEVVFLFSSNKNVPLQNIADIASGGEMARVMLSLKAMLTSKQQFSTIIFDEIDTGVSGRIAEKMALMMREMSRGGRQVVSITHLPQIAALGEYHYKVYKEDNEQTTATYIRELNPEERITEIAHMLSGTTLTEAAINNAKELLNQTRI
jgi:DNA repair protein RecN (Recombination protein N)